MYDPASPDYDPPTLRRWDDNGLIASTRTLGGQRRFLTEDVERVKSERAA